MKILNQIAILLALCFAAEGVALILPFAFPASVIAMLLLLVLLLTGALKLEHIGEATGFLSRNMAFFFLPAGVEILESYRPVADSIAPLAAVLVLTTVITFGVTAGTVTLCLRLQRRMGGKKA